jgi:hypothetical protein
MPEQKSNKMRLIALVLMVMFVVVSAKKVKKGRKKKKGDDPKDCEVCIKVITEIIAKVPKEKLKDTDLIEKIIDRHCNPKKNKQLSRQEKKVCYFIDPIKRDVSKPISFGMYPEEVCKRKLKKKSTDICGVKFPIKTTKNTNYKKMRVKHLKQILADRGVACRGCLEKRDYIKKVKETEHLAL